MEEQQEDTGLSDSDEVVLHDLCDVDSSELGEEISEDDNRDTDGGYGELLKKEVQLSSGNRLQHGALDISKINIRADTIVRYEVADNIYLQCIYYFTLLNIKTAF